MQTTDLHTRISTRTTKLYGKNTFIHEPNSFVYKVTIARGVHPVVKITRRSRFYSQLQENKETSRGYLIFSFVEPLNLAIRTMALGQKNLHACKMRHFLRSAGLIAVRVQIFQFIYINRTKLTITFTYS